MNLTNDQTAPLEPDNFTKSLKNKRVLIIGSGADIDGKRLKKLIDGNTFDVVARVNKHYGMEQDTGTRTDVIFTRWLQWIKKPIDFFSDEEIQNAKQVVILNQHVGYSENEKHLLLVELGHDAASAGLQAIHFFLNRDVREIYLLGFGMYSDGFKQSKKYCKRAFNYSDGMTDTNNAYDWNKERDYMLKQSKIRFI